MGREFFQFRPVPQVAPPNNPNFFTELISTVEVPVSLRDRVSDVTDVKVEYRDAPVDVIAAVVADADPNEDPDPDPDDYHLHHLHRDPPPFHHRRRHRRRHRRHPDPVADAHGLRVTLRLRPDQAPREDVFPVVALDTELPARVVARRDAFVEATVFVPPCDQLQSFFSVVDVTSPVVHELWDKYQNRLVKEGVSWSDATVSRELRERLRELVDELAQKTPVDHHPGTNLVVRDLVHPSLYPYVRNVSEVRGDLPVMPTPREDYWGRPYEDSDYQWLPSEFRVDKDGYCTIESYINNLDQDRFASLYLNLKRLFELALPHLERVYEFVQSVSFYSDMDSIMSGCQGFRPKDSPKGLRGRTLQVITKIVDYDLNEDQVFEGVWHVEGMSHENIIATAVYMLDRSPTLHGGELNFKRAMWDHEAQAVYLTVPQDRHKAVEAAVENGLMPLGKLATPVGRLVAFPNSHVHRVGELAGSGVRRIVVFWLVNPERRIISTANVPPQQGVMTKEEADRHRMALMRERKNHKQDWNVREIELCEH